MGNSIVSRAEKMGIKTSEVVVAIDVLDVLRAIADALDFEDIDHSEITDRELLELVSAGKRDIDRIESSKEFLNILKRRGS